MQARFRAWYFAQWLSRKLVPAVLRQETSFPCRQCEVLAPSKCDRTVQVMDGERRILPIVYRERHCEYCEKPHETIELQLPENWRDLEEVNLGTIKTAWLRKGHH